MQIVIEIPEDVYRRTVFYREFRDLSDCVATIEALEKATLLPKGHGVLKDVTNLMRGLYTDMQTDEMMFTSSEVYKLIDEECPTIIEADKVESEKRK